MLKSISSKSMIQMLSVSVMLTVIWFGAASFRAEKNIDAMLTFTGKVTGMYDIPLEGVKVKCENVSTKTDANGAFTLNVPDKNKEFYKISFSKKGYMSDYLDSIPAKGDKIYIMMIQK